MYGGGVMVVVGWREVLNSWCRARKSTQTYVFAVRVNGFLFVKSNRALKIECFVRGFICHTFPLCQSLWSC